MCSEAKDSADKDTELEKAKLLWDEYRYRHELCWKLISQITAAVVIIWVIPYIKMDITKALGMWMVTLPASAIALSLLSMMRLNKELDVLDTIRSKHRELQKDLFGTEYKGSSNFSRDVRCYFASLVVIGVADIAFLIYVGIPHLLSH